MLWSMPMPHNCHAMSSHTAPPHLTPPQPCHATPPHPISHDKALYATPRHALSHTIDTMRHHTTHHLVTPHTATPRPISWHTAHHLAPSYPNPPCLIISAALVTIGGSLDVENAPWCLLLARELGAVTLEQQSIGFIVSQVETDRVGHIGSGRS